MPSLFAIRLASVVVKKVNVVNSQICSRDLDHAPLGD